MHRIRVIHDQTSSTFQRYHTLTVEMYVTIDQITLESPPGILFSPVYTSNIRVQRYTILYGPPTAGEMLQ